MKCWVGLFEDCYKMDEGMQCSVYSPEGVMFRNRMGKCSFASATKLEESTTGKKRVGQQKQKGYRR